MIKRIQKQELSEALTSGKLLLISGPVGAGKKTLLENCLNELNYQICSIDCAKKVERKTLNLSDESYNTFVLYEAQFLPNIQEIVDSLIEGKLNIRLILVCSFTPALDEELIEAIQISGYEFKVYPTSFYEAAQHYGLTSIDGMLDQRIIYGNYAQVLENPADAEANLLSMIENAVRTNLGVKDRINKEKELFSLLRKLAFSIGEIITYHDLGQAVGLDNETVERYIDLLEKADLVIRLKSYSNDFRYELKKTNCVYFVDNGVRNALIQNFNSSEYRNDMPALWKNYLISEKIKWSRIMRSSNKYYFWRTHTKQQIDLLEINNNLLTGYIFDWEKRKKIKPSPYFMQCYPDAKTTVLNRNTYWSFLTKKLK